MMKAALLPDSGPRLQIVDDIQIDDPRSNEVLVRVSFCGVCNSDLSIPAARW